MQILTVLNVFSRILGVFALLMLCPVGVGLWYDNPVTPFLKSAGIAFPIGAILWFLTKRRVQEMKVRDGFLLATMTWAILPLFGALPFLFQMDSLSFTSAYFEACSGLTTTGATTWVGLDQLPETINFWRCFMIWIGGMGIIVLSVAILPLLGVGGSQIFKAETPGPMKDNKLTPRITQTAKGLWLVYFFLTLICGLCYYWAGMSAIDAVVHAFSTAGLGGFSSHDASFAYWHSPTIDTITVFFMLLAGINYGTHFQALRTFSFSPYRLDTETRWFLGIVLCAASAVSLYLWHTGIYSDWTTAIHYGFFNVISVATTTGFANTDYGLWPVFISIGMLLLCCFVTCAGSTGSGIKMIRAIVLVKQLANELIRAVHTNAYVSVKIGGRVVNTQTVFSVFTFFFIYVLVLAIIMLVLCISGLEPGTALSAALAGLNNTGPGINEIGPSSTYAVLTDFQIWVLIVAMFLGRLEIFAVLVIFTPGFWKK